MGTNITFAVYTYRLPIRSPALAYQEASPWCKHKKNSWGRANPNQHSSLKMEKEQYHVGFIEKKFILLIINGNFALHIFRYSQVLQIMLVSLWIIELSQTGEASRFQQLIGECHYFKYYSRLSNFCNVFAGLSNGH